MNMRVISARITPMPKDIFDKIPEVYVTIQNGVEHYLWNYYPDEISFTPREFIGLTLSDAEGLKYKKDIEYLRS